MRKCKICGYEVPEGAPHYMTKRGIVCSEKCHTELFWEEKVIWAEDCRTEEEEPVFRFKGEHFVIAAEDEETSFRGGSGRLYYVYYCKGPFAGKIIKTTNLWSQGIVPEKYENLLPDNATLMEPSEYHNYVAEGWLQDVPVVVFKNNVAQEDRTGQWTEVRLVEVESK